MWKPENLILCCSDCNTSKGTTDVLTATQRSLLTTRPYTYPFASEHYTIVHPYIDRYEDYITREKHIFYKAVDNKDKGLKTIIICNLYRLNLIEDNIKKAKNSAISLFTRFISKSSEEQLPWKDNIRSTLEYFKGRNLFNAFIKMEMNTGSMKLVDELKDLAVKISLVTEEHIKLVEILCEDLEYLERYIEVMDKLSNVKIPSQLTIKEYNLSYSLDDCILLNEDGFILLNCLIKKGGQFHPSVQSWLEDKLNSPQILKVPSILTTLKVKSDWELVLELLNLFHDMFKADSRYNYAEEMIDNSLALKRIKDQTQIIGEWKAHNPRLKIVEKLDLIYKILLDLNREKIVTSKQKIKVLLRRTIFKS
ncbi:hypothetical protein V7139_27610 [Neobacillus drentensis]